MASACCGHRGCALAVVRAASHGCGRSCPYPSVLGSACRDALTLSPPACFSSLQRACLLLGVWPEMGRLVEAAGGRAQDATTGTDATSTCQGASGSGSSSGSTGGNQEATPEVVTAGGRPQEVHTVPATTSSSSSPQGRGSGGAGAHPAAEGPGLSSFGAGSGVGSGAVGPGPAAGSEPTDCGRGGAVVGGRRHLRLILQVGKREGQRAACMVGLRAEPGRSSGVV